MRTPMVVLSLWLTPFASAQPVSGPLTPADVAAGWVELSGPGAKNAWHIIGQTGFPSVTWTADDTTITCKPDPRAGTGRDLISVREFGDFELVFEFMTTPRANSGVKYRVDDTTDNTQAFGPEYQVIDDAGEKLAPTDEHSAGSLYDLAPPAPGKALHPPGEWNSARILVRNGVAQHWLNGLKVVEVPIEGPQWRALVADSKFKDSKTFAASARGHIALQDHGGEVSYRNIRARDLAAPLPAEVVLFNGKDLDGWMQFPAPAKDAPPVWTVSDGLLLCTGNPAGYLRTAAAYTNFVLKVEWRFNPVTKKAGNSGVLLRMIGEDKVWPRSIEAQLQSGAAGDFWNIGEFPMKTDDARRKGRNTVRTHTAEREIGEWNEYEIIVDHAQVTLRVNGETLNHAVDALETPGKICLQSEGAEIQFRTVRLAPIP